MDHMRGFIQNDQVPEHAIGVTTISLDRLISNSGLGLVEHYQGGWKRVSGVFFQDVLIFQKA